MNKVVAIAFTLVVLLSTSAYAGLGVRYVEENDLDVAYSLLSDTHFKGLSISAQSAGASRAEAIFAANDSLGKGIKNQILDATRNNEVYRQVALMGSFQYNARVISEKLHGNTWYVTVSASYTGREMSEMAYEMWLTGTAKVEVAGTRSAEHMRASHDVAANVEGMVAQSADSSKSMASHGTLAGARALRAIKHFID